MVAKTVIDALTIFYTLLGVSLFVPMMAGLYDRRAGAVSALASAAAGVGLVFWCTSRPAAGESVA